jgi:CubicO group peptidase (beta-lactamase class C family)
MISTGVGSGPDEMLGSPQLTFITILALWIAVITNTLAQQPSSPGPAPLEHGLEIIDTGLSAPQHLDLDQALQALKIPSVSIALIDRGEVAWARAYGGSGASTRTLYQAASLSKLVAAVAAMRLVQQGRLDLDGNVNAALSSWHIPDSAWTRGHPVTVRGLLSMTGGIGVPGYMGYEPGAPLPTLVQILDGVPPANSPPVRVEIVPGSRYAYSGGGYEIVQAIIQDVTRKLFEEAVQDLVLRPAGMADSLFAQPLPTTLVPRAATGHDADGRELPGGWRVVPELAAGGLWSTPTDVAQLLIEIARAYRGEASRLLDRETARAMLTPQNGGPYGLGGAVSGSGPSLVLMKRGQNVGYQSYMLIFPETGQGIVVMTGSDNGTTLATALIHRAALAYGWPPLSALPD